MKKVLLWSEELDMNNNNSFLTGKLQSLTQDEKSLKAECLTFCL